MKIMQVIVGIITNSQNEILIAQRPPDKYKGGLWEFPGGKIEKDETHFAALKRELFEEIAIIVLEAQPWLEIKHDYGDRIVQLHTWRVTKFSGEACGKEGQQIKWISPKQLTDFEFPQGNQLIIKELESIFVN